MPSVRIVTDSASDLPQELVDEHGIGIVPLKIRFGDTEYVDREELTAAQFYERMAASPHLPATAAPSPGAFDEMFTAMASKGADAVVCINLSAELSATMAAAQNAAAGRTDGLDVRVLDSRSITSGLGTQVLEAAKLAAAGGSADDIEALIADLSHRGRVLGALDTLDNLKKGGRIGGAQAMVGTMLSIKPIIDISTGVVKEAAKQRTRKKAMAWLRDQLAEAGEVEHLCICHGHAPDFEEFKEVLAAEVDISDARESIIGPVIGAHGGPRMLGLTWIDA